MITYIFQIDLYNRIVEKDGEIYSETNVVEHMNSMGWIINPYDWYGEKNRQKRNKLYSIFSQRNFFRYERRLKYYEELRDGIFHF
jgi:hypothetical protein